MTKSLHSNPQLHARHRKASRFRIYGLLGVLGAFLALCVLLFSIVSAGWQGFLKTEIRLTFTAQQLAGLQPGGASRDALTKAVRAALLAHFPEVTNRMEKRRLYQMLSIAASTELADALETETPKRLTVWLTAASSVDMAIKGNAPLDALESGWLESLQESGEVRLAFNAYFLTNADSREPELAGFWGSMAGSLFTILCCMGVALPIGVLSAIYLQELAPKNRLIDFIEVNINNLAAVPSIIFGLLGLAVYLDMFGLGRSSAVAGGLTLALMILPTIIIATRAALKAVPDSIRDAARGLGASELQVISHHTFPLAIPGIMTGTILGIARALGETAPLLMIGMVAFMADVPGSATDPATVMPVQVYLWSDSPELAFKEKTSAGIMILLAVLIVLNACAVYIRKKYERQW